MLTASPSVWNPKDAVWSVIGEVSVCWLSSALYWASTFRNFQRYTRLRMALKDVDPGTTTHMSSSSLNTFLVAGRQQLRVQTRTGASMYFDYEDESGACAGFFWMRIWRPPISHILGEWKYRPPPLLDALTLTVLTVLMTKKGNIKDDASKLYSTGTLWIISQLCKRYFIKLHPTHFSRYK